MKGIIDNELFPLLVKKKLFPMKEPLLLSYSHSGEGSNKILTKVKQTQQNSNFWACGVYAQAAAERPSVGIQTPQPCAGHPLEADWQAERALTFS